MKRFRFSLERLLEYRRSRAEETRRQFAIVLAEVERINSEILRLQNEREELAKKLLEFHLSAETRREVCEARSFLEFLWLKMQRLHGELKTWKQRLEDARLDMQEAERELETVERLRMRELERHEGQEERREQKDSDDAAINSHLRRTRKEAPGA